MTLSHAQLYPGAELSTARFHAGMDRRKRTIPPSSWAQPEMFAGVNGPFIFHRCTEGELGMATMYPETWGGVGKERPVSCSAVIPTRYFDGRLFLDSATHPTTRFTEERFDYSGIVTFANFISSRESCLVHLTAAQTFTCQPVIYWIKQIDLQWWITQVKTAGESLTSDPNALPFWNNHVTSWDHVIYPVQLSHQAWIMRSGCSLCNLATCAAGK